MVTAVDPDFDIIEVGLGELVDSLFRRRNHEETVREYFALVPESTALESTKPQPLLDDSEEYTELVDRLASINEDAARHLTTPSKTTDSNPSSVPSTNENGISNPTANRSSSAAR